MKLSTKNLINSNFSKSKCTKIEQAYSHMSLHKTSIDMDDMICYMIQKLAVRNCNVIISCILLQDGSKGCIWSKSCDEEGFEAVSVPKIRRIFNQEVATIYTILLKPGFVSQDDKPVHVFSKMNNFYLVNSQELQKRDKYLKSKIIETLLSLYVYIGQKTSNSHWTNVTLAKHEDLSSIINLLDASNKSTTILKNKTEATQKRFLEYFRNWDNERWERRNRGPIDFKAGYDSCH